MWNKREPAGEDGSDTGNGNGNVNGYDKIVAKTAGFVVFSGIAMSIIKALNPFNKPDLKLSPDTSTNVPSSEPIKPLSESTQPTQAPVFQQCQPSLAPPKELIIKKPDTCIEQHVEESLPKVIEIVRGDTLWGLSRKYGVSIEAIKEANGLAGDTIYAGKRLKIP